MYPSNIRETITFGPAKLIYTPDLIDRLLDLISEYLIGHMDGIAFRERFVMDFLSRSVGEPLASITMLIESAFVGLDPARMLSEDQFNRELWTIAAAVEVMRDASMPEQRRFMRVGPIG